MKIVITGGAHGLGLAMVKALAATGHKVHILDRDLPDDGAIPFGAYDHQPEFTYCDVRYADSIRSAIAYVKWCDVLINNAGVNRIGYLEDFTEEDFDYVMNTNAKSLFTVTKAFLPLLKESQGTILNIVSNAAHMPMTGSLAYNMSKGAAHIATLQLARELRPRHGITVFGIAPNRLAGTEMSKDIDRQVCESRGWSPEYAREYQLKSLQAGEETDPGQLARFVAYLFERKDNHKYLTGTILPYGL